jgi:CRISPR/Cas system-associated protein Cas10 (large subunit of type III CRISPR-Cas system)
MTCNHCGGDFHARADAKFCKKAECQRERKRANKPYVRVDHPERDCEQCGSAFKPTKSSNLFCKKQRCVASRNRAKDARRAEKLRADFNPSDIYLGKRYGITSKDRDTMLNAAGHACEICGRRDALVVDHDHNTGELRGILCRVCNLAIGNLGDTIESVERAVAYLAASVGRNILGDIQDLGSA